MAYGVLIHFSLRACNRSVITLLACALAAACSAPEYSSPAWSGRVIERDTGAPIEGAIVVVRWELEGFDSKFAGWLLMDEAVTDKDGIFRFKAWGPTRTPDDHGSRTRMSPNVPDISVFKSGYEVAISGGGSDSGYLDDRFYKGPSIRKVYADDHVIALDRFYGDLNGYRVYLDRFLSITGPACNFQMIPRMYAAVIAEDRKLKTQTGRGLQNYSLSELQARHIDERCDAKVVDVVRRYIQ